MSRFRKLAKNALNENKESKLLFENFLYEDGMTERMHPKLEEDLRKGRHSLAECDVFPEGDVISSEMKLIRERFKEVVYRCREAFDVDQINNMQIMQEMMPLVFKSMDLEEPHIQELEELAVRMVMEEFDIPEDTIVFEAELTREISLDGTSKNPTPQLVDEEFNDHAEIERANAEVKKRRVLNAMTQGAAKRVNHMFHMVHEELSNMNPRLPQNYKKMMSAADYMYYVVPDIEKGNAGGVCECEFQGEEDDMRPVIKAKAMTFPVLIHELVKGVMEVLSAHGLPTQENIAEYVIGKADFLEAEPWDMRLGPAMWGRFCEMIPDVDFGIKHHVYTEIASMEPDEFNTTMKEILAKTKRGKGIINQIIAEVKEELKQDDFNESMGDSHFNIEDLL